MRRQRNMAEMKELNKIPEKEVNKMEISNLSDAEFKTLVIRMLEELSGYFNNIKKTQAEMKVTLSEIKKNLKEPTVEGMKLKIKSMIWNIRWVGGVGEAFKKNSKKKEFKKTQVY